MSLEDPRAKADVALVEKCLQHLGEHFDSVQIFATRDEPAEREGTIKISKGVGNWYARYGQVVEWVEISNEDARVYARKTE
jgi:hypothetical protein